MSRKRELAPSPLPLLDNTVDARTIKGQFTRICDEMTKLVEQEYGRLQKNAANTGLILR